MPYVYEIYILITGHFIEQLAHWENLQPFVDGIQENNQRKLEDKAMSNFTKRAMEDSLKHLLFQKPLNKITVSDITEDCGINRMTFYYHFKDIYDLIEWVCVEDATKALNGKKTYKTWQEGLLNIFNEVLKNKPFIMNVYRCISREQVELYLYQLTYDLIYGAVEEKAVGMTVREDDKKFIVDFYKYGFVGIMLEWIRNDMKEDPKHIVEQLEAMIHGNISRALNAVRTDKPLSDQIE